MFITDIYLFFHLLCFSYVYLKWGKPRAAWLISLHDYVLEWSWWGDKKMLLSCECISFRSFSLRNQSGNWSVIILGFIQVVKICFFPREKFYCEAVFFYMFLPLPPSVDKGIATRKGVFFFFLVGSRLLCWKSSVFKSQRKRTRRSSCVGNGGK